MSNSAGAGMVPVEIKQAGPQELQITWADGHVSVYPVVYLRRSCRCAACIDEWTGAPLLDPAKISDEVRPIRINPVGRYAISIEWSDGHKSGIYTFEHLREIGSSSRDAEAD